MSNLDQLANAKVGAATQRQAEKLDADVEALKRLNAAKGLLKSGATVKQVIRLCEGSFVAIRDAASTEFGWVIQESLWVSPSLPEQLIAHARQHLQVIFEASEKHLEKITNLVGHPDLYARLQPDLVAARDRAWTDISLALEGQVQVKKNRFWKGAGGKLFGWIPKLFGLSK